VTIAPGAFVMGSWRNEPLRGENETRRRVTLTVGFEMMAREGTQGEVRRLRGYNPSAFLSCGADCPVERVNWHEALAYANALSREEGREECYGCPGSGAAVTCALDSRFRRPQDCPGYRLPTEAEWEYAYRASTTTTFYNGLLGRPFGRDANLDRIGWFTANCGRRTHPGGLKQPNGWGLYDMAGNVWEWIGDWYAEDYPSGSITDPRGGSIGSVRVIRGGGWTSEALFCRAAVRGFSAPGERDNATGFRLVRSLAGGT